MIAAVIIILGVALLAFVWALRREILRGSRERIALIEAKGKEELARIAYEADADRLAVCVRDYIVQMDEYSKKLGDQPLALKRERDALYRHQNLKESNPCPPSPS